MNPDVFFKNFELLADAPNGVQKLRELILQLAVMGKLVPQDSNDEPASVLLEKIKAEKKELVKGNNGRNSKKSDTTISDEIFDIPSNWIWTKLDTLGITQTGTTPSKSQPEFFGNYIPFIKPADMSESGVRYDNEMLSELGLNSGRLIPKNSVLMVCIGGSIGKTCLVDRNISCNQQINAVSPFYSVDCKFITFVFKSRYFQDQVMEKASIGTLPIINKSKWEQISVPLPPLTEQKRIVSKVDELMVLCDKLEAHRQKKQEIQSKLNSAALDRMLSVENQEEFEQYWQRICENFDLLYDNPENIEKLKQAILQLAVQGKLVPQNPEDEPASVLIEKIQATKEKLIREGKSQKAKPLPDICLEELPYDLPDCWIWTRLGDISNSLRYGTSKKCAYNTVGCPVLRIPNIVNGKIDTSDLKFTQLSTKEIEDLKLDSGDLLLVRSNGSTSLVGRSAVINSNLSGYAYAGYLVRLKTFSSCISPDYLHLVLESSYVRDQIEMPIRTTSGVKNINSFEISRLLLPIPPLDEQKRIVEKVEQLMGLCNELEAKLRREREDIDKLMEAVVKGLLEGAAVIKKTELEKPIQLQAAAIQLK